jgi:predicted DNA-binding transcriptional regulator YafY
MPGEGYRLLEGYYLPPITFSAAEARALFLAISMLSGLTSEGETQTAATAALDKIRAILPPSTLHQLEALQAIIHFYAFPSTVFDFDAPAFLRLQEAIHQHQVVHLRYHAQHTNEVTEREVEPLNLLYLDKTWVLTAYCRLRRASRVFRLDRIDRLRVLEETFAVREWGEGQQRGRRPLQITIRFDKSILRWVQERQHFSYAYNQDEHTMIYHPRSFDQIEGWLLSWGDKMELLDPPDLRQQLHETVLGMLAQHQP